MQRPEYTVFDYEDMKKSHTRHIYLKLPKKDLHAMKILLLLYKYLWLVIPMLDGWETHMAAMSSLELDEKNRISMP